MKKASLAARRGARKRSEREKMEERGASVGAESDSGTEEDEASGLIEQDVDVVTDRTGDCVPERVEEGPSAAGSEPNVGLKNCFGSILAGRSPRAHCSR